MKKYFLSFCQHHGIPTNLIDISYSPLVALFFVCDGKSDFKFCLNDLVHGKNIEDIENATSLQSILIHNLINKYKKKFHSKFAQVYVIKKERLIDITEIIIKLNGKSLFEELLCNDDLVVELFCSINKHFNENINEDISKEWILNLLSFYKEECDLYGEMLMDMGNLYKLVNDIIKILNNKKYENGCEILLNDDIEKYLNCKLRLLINN